MALNNNIEWNKSILGRKSHAKEVQDSQGLGRKYC